MTQRHIVTGAFGFSGKYIARRLLQAGHEVLTLTNSPHRPNPFGGAVRPLPWNFDDPDALARSLEGTDVLYNTYWVRFNHSSNHAAANRGNGANFTHSEARRNTLTLFEAARRAEVKRVVHVSITNADAASPLEYFRDKGILEDALRASGLGYAILRPAVLFGPEDILINNIAWTIRRFPIFCVFGDGKYPIEPIHADDLAALAIKLGHSNENMTVNAVGPERFTYRELVRELMDALGKRRPIIGVPPRLGYALAWMVGRIMGDEFVTREEIRGLMAGLLGVPPDDGLQPSADGAQSIGTAVPDAPPRTRLTEWAREHHANLGRRYASEMARRRDRRLDYVS